MLSGCDGGFYPGMPPELDMQCGAAQGHKAADGHGGEGNSGNVQFKNYRYWFGAHKCRHRTKSDKSLSFSISSAALIFWLNRVQNAQARGGRMPLALCSMIYESANALSKVQNIVLSHVSGVLPPMASIDVLLNSPPGNVPYPLKMGSQFHTILDGQLVEMTSHMPATESSYTAFVPLRPPSPSLITSHITGDPVDAKQHLLEQAKPLLGTPIDIADISPHHLKAESPSLAVFSGTPIDIDIVQHSAMHSGSPQADSNVSGNSTVVMSRMVESPSSQEDRTAALGRPRRQINQRFGGHRSDMVAANRRRSSRFRGVTKHRRSGRWEAHIWIKDIGRQVYLGGYENEEHAAEAYDVAAIKCKGRRVKTNFEICRSVPQFSLVSLTMAWSSRKCVYVLHFHDRASPSNNAVGKFCREHK